MPTVPIVPTVPTDAKRLHALVSGRVQGVSYRAFTAHQAHNLGLTGWVRNLPDRRVELVAEGPPPALESLLAACQQGPPGARVTQVQATWLTPTGEFTRFEIRP